MAELKAVDAYISKEQWFADVAALAAALNQVKLDKKMRRLWANAQRSVANEVDDETNLGIEEVNEELPVDIDYEPVMPIPAPEVTHPGD